MNEITQAWLAERNACNDGIVWFKSQKVTHPIRLIQKLIRLKKPAWANWLIVRVMSRPQYLSYAIFAAEQVIDLFGEKYPNEKRPQKAIEAAKKCLLNDSEENRANAAYATANAANAAAYDAYDADAANAAANAANAAYAAANAAYAAAHAACAAAHAACAAADAADAANAAYAAAYAATNAMRLKILKYGLSLLKK